MPVEPLRPSQIGAPGSLNVYSSTGKSAPAFKQFVLDSTDKLHYATNVIEYKAPTGNGGQPRQYASIDRKVYRLDNGTVTNDTENFQSTRDNFNSVIQGMVIFDIPSITNVNSFTPGTSGLIISFGNRNPDPANTTFEGVYYRSLATDTTPYAVNGDAGRSVEATQGTTYLTCYQMVKAGPDLYAVCDAGVATGIGDWRVSKCPAGSNPILITSWGNGVEVGGSEWIITGLAAIGAAPVVGKPDGLYYYDEQTRRYENVLKHYELSPHPLNGKVTQSVTGGVIYTTYDGRAFFFDGTVVQEVSPHKYWPILSRDIGTSRITACADAGDVIYLYTELAHTTTQNASIQVRAVTSAGAASDIGANLVDGNFTTGSGTALDSLASGFIDVFASVPFEGVVIHTTRSPNGTTTAVIDGVSYLSANDTWTSDSAGFIDGTRLSSGGSFSYTGFPPSASNGVVMGKSLNFGSLQQSGTYNYASGTDVTSAGYGMRISISGTLDSDTEIDEIEIIPYRAGMPNSGIYSATTNFTPRDRAGLVGHVVGLRRNRTTGFVPHDMFAVNSYPGVWGMALHNGRLGQASGGQNLGQNLVLWGRYTTTAINMSPTRDPIRSRYPLLQDVGTVAPGFLQQIMYDFDGGDASRLKVGNWLFINTQFLQPTDAWEVFAQFDNHDIVSIGRGLGGPIYFDIVQSEWRYINMWVGINQAASTPETAPQLIEPYRFNWDWVGGDAPRDRAQQIPVTT